MRHIPVIVERFLSPVFLKTLLPTIAAGALIGSLASPAPEAAHQAPASEATGQSAAAAPEPRALLDRYCVACHSDRLRTGGLSLQSLSVDAVGDDAETWEKVLRKIRAGAMPPAGRRRPTPAEAGGFVAWLEGGLDRAAAVRPDPGRPAVHRLNRVEYRNAIRDLLGLDVDVMALLPSDDSALGFDNIAEVLSVSPALLERYMSAARRVSQLALGDPALRTTTYVVPRDLAQDDRVSEDLPLGSTGGLAVSHYFPADGEYLIKVRLQRNTMDEIRGLLEPRQVDVRVDGERVKLFTIGGDQPEAGKDGVAAVHSAVMTYLINGDNALEVRMPMKAGTHAVAATVLGQRLKAEGPYQPRITPKSMDQYQGRNDGFGIGRLEIQGPNDPVQESDRAGRGRLFVCQPPSQATGETACARQILSTLARRAFRRPVSDAEVKDLMTFYAAGRATSTAGSFDRGIDVALRRVLVSPHFLFRVERDPAGVAPGSPYRLPDIELASRLSFFLWSSIPDDELLDLGVQGRLKDPAVLAQQVRRMLRDDRSSALLENFAGQWLEVRNLPLVSPNEEVFAEFDENIRQAFKQETDLFLESILREDRSVVDLLTADYTFLNERLARFYGIPGVYGERFRRVTLTGEHAARAGVLGHGSVLSVTSYATRTSPVLRGKWILSNLLGAPPPPPPPDVPALQEKAPDGKALSMRMAMEAHRKNPVCAGCHAPMDPLGFSLENFDAIGRWRTMSESKDPVDASGAWPDGTSFHGPGGLRQMLLKEREQFVGTLTDKLLTYAVGRGLDPADMPAVRTVVRKASADNYRLSSVVLEIVRSMPFQMRRAAGPS